MEEASPEQVRVVELDTGTSEGEVVEQVDGAEKVEPTVATEEKGKVRSRAKHKCPFTSCNKEVVHLPRHMRQVHNWSQDRASGVLAAFDIRKPRSPRKLKEGKKSRVYKRRMCPVVNCNSVVKKIHNHLTDVHKLTRKSKIYWRCVKSAIVYRIRTPSYFN